MIISIFSIMILSFLFWLVASVKLIAEIVSSATVTILSLCSALQGTYTKLTKPRSLSLNSRPGRGRMLSTWRLRPQAQDIPLPFHQAKGCRRARHGFLAAPEKEKVRSESAARRYSPVFYGSVGRSDKQP